MEQAREEGRVTTMKMVTDRTVCGHDGVIMMELMTLMCDGS